MVKAFLLVVLIGLGILAGFGYLNRSQFISDIPIQIQTIKQKTNKPFSVDIAPTQSLPATIASISGEVLWQSRIATEAAVIKSSQNIYQGETISTKNGTAEIIFKSRAKFVLNKNTEIELSQTLPINIVVMQTAGETTYEVDSDQPFSVRSFGLLVEIKKGVVTVITDEEAHTVNLMIKSGTATIAYNDRQYIVHTLALKTGDSTLFNSDLRRFVD